jgi:hypothetical protein
MQFYLMIQSKQIPRDESFFQLFDNKPFIDSSSLSIKQLHQSTESNPTVSAGEADLNEVDDGQKM